MITAAACAAALVPAGVALAAYQDDDYAGVTEQGEQISFRVADERVKRFSAVANADCADGTRQRVTVENGRTGVFEGGRFAIELTGDPKLTISVTAKLHDSQVSGRIKASLSPPGTSCAVDTRWRGEVEVRGEVEAAAG